ncbi:MAG: response regulator, partial [Sphingobacteriaceae bacterium]
MKNIRISAVSYTNTKPFIYGLQHHLIQNEIDLSLDTPSDCAQKFIDNKADIGLIPVAALLNLPYWQIVSEYCIGAVGAVNSVFIFSNCPIEEADIIQFDPESRSSNNLAKVLCKERNLGGIKVESEYKKGSVFSFILPVHSTKTALARENHQVSCEFSSIDVDEGEIEENKLMNYQNVLPQKQISVRKPPSSLEREFTLGSPLNKEVMSPMIPSRPHVLIVDDNPLNITVAEYFVKSEKYETKTALYGHIAIEIVLKNNHKLTPIKLILMDLQMPIMDGYQTTKALRDLMESGKIPEI